ncbi:hypothetical protein CCACVL1_23754 [Corchorus capsularis]|uniref:Uncharacterized protein n=1 Tax=Corchorus capsularis TaxID=210143 RepID=A0A1R3GSM2_COCAP|nr:hypothetical protein CCACVL1_23754 [Corchorus capsularis]
MGKQYRPPNLRPQLPSAPPFGTQTVVHRATKHSL